MLLIYYSSASPTRLPFFDITGRRQTEENLRAGEERMRLAAESTKDYAIITMDTESRITSWNKGAERMFGHTEESMLGQPADLIFTVEDRENGAPDDERRRAREEGRAEDERWHICARMVRSCIAAVS